VKAVITYPHKEKKNSEQHRWCARWGRLGNVIKNWMKKSKVQVNLQPMCQ